MILCRVATRSPGFMCRDSRDRTATPARAMCHPFWGSTAVDPKIWNRYPLDKVIDNRWNEGHDLGDRNRHRQFIVRPDLLNSRAEFYVSPQTVTEFINICPGGWVEIGPRPKNIAERISSSRKRLHRSERRDTLRRAAMPFWGRNGAGSDPLQSR